MLSRVSIFIIFSFVLFSSNARSEIYKCIVDGVTTFSQQPCNNSVPPSQGKSDTKSEIQKANKPSTETNTLSHKAETKFPFSGNEKAHIWIRDGIKTCTLYKTHKFALQDYKTLQAMKNSETNELSDMAKLALALAEAKNKTQEVQQFLDSIKTSKLQPTCDSGATAKCHNFVVSFNDLLEEQYYTDDNALLASLRKDCEEGGGARFTMLK